MKVTLTFTNHNPNTIWNQLAKKLGRDPSNAECRDEIFRILDEVTVEKANKGKLRQQK